LQRLIDAFVVASILDFWPAGQFMNLDVFFTFSDIGVCFRQVANCDSV
jgi:hypothetical protein